MAIEVDVKIETDKELEYIFEKSDKLLEFGVKQIIWVITKSKKIFVMSKTETWKVVNWHDDVQLLEGIMLNLKKLLDEEEVVY